MSKVVRNRLQQTMQYLKEATEVIVCKSTDLQDGLTQQNTQFVELLTDTQNLAIALGTRIEELKGIGTHTVKELEGYCECLFRVNKSMGTEELSEAAEALAGQMEQVQVAFEADFPDKKEIVFLPYKASMWDSLESVWKAADADPECEAYVVPIPYYTLDGQHNFKDFCYEGDQYPDYVPIIDYKTYDLKLHHPDIIFIHNPYDNYNVVTSVDPKYYSSKLRDDTECLVYIPYFVVDETRDINKLEHYAVCPAVFYADYVIVQSEMVREKYLESLNRYFKKQGNAATDYAKKIFGIGSPKFDSVRSHKPQFQDLPEEWRDIIGNGDKKIIFYNTHLNLVMPLYYERFILKLKGVLSYFKQRQDVVLLWRPHPLTIPTIESMNPKALESYLDIVNQYKADKWGIYDDTPDLDRSIALSDAYYGSDSSVVPIYRQTGKPVLLHSLNVPTEVI